MADIVEKNNGNTRNREILKVCGYSIIKVKEKKMKENEMRLTRDANDDGKKFIMYPFLLFFCHLRKEKRVLQETCQKLNIYLCSTPLY